MAKSRTRPHRYLEVVVMSGLSDGSARWSDELKSPASETRLGVATAPGLSGRMAGADATPRRPHKEGPKHYETGHLDGHGSDLVALNGCLNLAAALSF